MESNGVWGVNGVVCVGGVLLAAASVSGSAGNEAIALVNVSVLVLSAVPTQQN